MDAQTIAASLSTVDGWKAIGSGGLFGGKAKQSLEKWQASSEKGVVPLYTLRRDEHDSYYYAVYAFSTKGGLTDAEIAELTAAVREIPLGMIRFESADNSYFCDMRNFQHTLDETDDEQDQISVALSDEKIGRFVFVQSRGTKSKLDAPYVVFGLANRHLYVYPIPEANLSKLG